MDKREQILDVLFNSSRLDESKENLEEGFVGNVARAAGTAVKHAAQNAVNNVKNSFAITTAQKNNARLRTQALQNAQAEEKAANKQIANAGKAGKAAYKDTMNNWTQKDCNNLLTSIAKDFNNGNPSLDGLVKGIQSLLVGSRLLHVANDNSDTANQVQNKSKNDDQETVAQGKENANIARNGQQQTNENLWLYTRNLDYEKLNEAFGAGTVKTALKNIQNNYQQYLGFKKKGDVKQAKAFGAKTFDALQSAATYLRSIGKGFFNKDTGKNLGGTIDKSAYDSFMKVLDKYVVPGESGEQLFDALTKPAEAPQDNASKNENVDNQNTSNNQNADNNQNTGNSQGVDANQNNADTNQNNADSQNNTDSQPNGQSNSAGDQVNNEQDANNTNQANDANSATNQNSPSFKTNPNFDVNSASKKFGVDANLITQIIQEYEGANQ